MIYYAISNTSSRDEVNSINSAEWFITKIIFKNRILDYNGQEFEDFFVSIMTKSNPEFRAVKAYGNIGDRKNDGFDRTTGTYYQVFAPENIMKEKTTRDGMKKLETDLNGLYEYWNPICLIQNYFFVINDKYNGVPAPIIEMIEILNNDPRYENIKIRLFSAKDLERVFDELSDDSKQDIIGFIPEETVPMLEIEALHEVVTYMTKTELPVDYQDSLTVPDFDEKIIFNNLSSVVADQLTAGSYQDGLLKQYFNETPGAREILQKRFHALYEQAKKEIPESVENYSDQQFYYILEQACPKRTLPIQTSVLVLMAYYFSSCDIFKEPQL